MSIEEVKRHEQIRAGYFARQRKIGCLFIICSLLLFIVDFTTFIPDLILLLLGVALITSREAWISARTEEEQELMDYKTGKRIRY